MLRREVAAVHRAYVRHPDNTSLIGINIGLQTCIAILRAGRDPDDIGIIGDGV